MQTIFGPVPSRRLGRSLGIDVIPPKTCSLDCIYCESGPTTRLTMDRQCFVEPEAVLRDLERYFRNHPSGAEVLTFSSAGEPTLYEPIGELIREIKRRYSRLPLVVLTNGTLLWDPKVREDLLRADRVVPSLDAVSAEGFKSINRPHPGLSLSLMLEGLRAFRRDYRGELHVEVMLVAGVNDDPSELRRIAEFLGHLNPDRIELNTVVRPPAEETAEGLSMAEMRKACDLFPADKTVIIGSFRGSGRVSREVGVEERVLELVQRRPCTLEEMAASLGLSLPDLEDAVVGLERNGLVRRCLFGGQEFLVRVDG